MSQLIAIPMFYGAADRKTAIAETYEPARGADAVVTAGLFKTVRDLNLLDLTALPSFPSLFDEIRRHLRPVILFLRSFVQDLSRSVEKDGREHIGYVPTQIVTEFLRHRFRANKGRRVHGILYPSSRGEDGICCVLFCNQANCSEVLDDPYPEPKRWLKLEAGSVDHIEPKDLPEMSDSR